jgi:hypothetical protein
MSDALTLLAEHLADPASSWSIGTYGVLAEFAREPSEPCERSELQVVTARGAIRVAADPATSALAYEVLSAAPMSWHHGVLFTLPDAAMPARRVITELGTDRDAIRGEDRGAALFDLGFGATAFAFCVRTADPGLLACLRRAAGKPLLDAGRDAAGAIIAASPHRVAFSRLARIEVYQRIASEDGATPSGPHTHVLPRLLRPHLAYSANIRVPEGRMPGLTLYPPHPAKDEAGVAKPFAPAEHAAFESLLERCGDPEARAAKAAVMQAIERGEPPGHKPATRIARQAARIALRQLRLGGASGAALAAWERALEPATVRAAA